MPTKNEIIHASPARPLGIMDIKTAEGEILYELKLKEIAQGLKDGWLSLDDETRRNEMVPWQSIRQAFGKTFDVRVFINTPRAFAEKYGIWGAIGLGGLVLIVGLFAPIGSGLSNSGANQVPWIQLVSATD